MVHLWVDAASFSFFLFFRSVSFDSTRGTTFTLMSHFDLPLENYSLIPRSYEIVVAFVGGTTGCFFG